MSPWQILRTSVRALIRHKARTLLTTLGMVIGIAAVITTIAVGEGAKVKLAESFNNMGTNLLIVRSGSGHTGGAHGGFGSVPTVTLDDIAAMRDLSKVRRVSPRPEQSMQLLSAGSNWKCDVGGIIPEFFDIRIWRIKTGRNISTTDVENGAKVLVLGLTTAAKLFGPGVDPIGAEVRIANIPFTVIGLLDHKGSAPGGYDLDDNAYVPFTTYVEKLQGGGLRHYVNGSIYVGATSAADAAGAEAQIAALLRERHHLAPGVEDDFQIRNMVEAAEAEAEGARTMATLLAAIAAVSLVIAGIGIMNIMLVSVTERTREIGLRMAVGARPRAILWHFLAEALILSLVGGIGGAALGVLGADTIGSALGWPLYLRSDGIVVSIAVSAAVGLFFGVYPAMRAAALDPIEALRFES
ncbi:MAG TPA: ABC transporter permease [Polyangia bacterium]